MAEQMRPMLLEVKRGPECWQARSDYTFGTWIDTPWGRERPLPMVLEDLRLLNPFYLVVAPEVEQEMVWEDA